MNIKLLLCNQLKWVTFNAIFVCGVVNAQNTSYNANSIPIGGTFNVAFGNFCLLNITTGQFNTGTGIHALNSQSTGNNNSAFGAKAMYQNNSGNDNTAIGNESLWNDNLGSYNTAVGSNAARMYSGDYNTALGYNSLSGFLSGSGNYNTAVGSSSLVFNSGGSYNTAMGYGAGVGASSLTNSTAIGNGAVVNNSNTIQLGNSSVTSIYAGVGTAAKLITGGLQVTGGTPGVGKVLTSDASGNATWQTPGGGFGSDWSTTGNTGTVDGVNFIGTTDNAPFNIRVKNQKAGRIDPLTFGTFYGYLAGNNNSSGASNNAFGYRALESNTTGNDNIAIGLFALNQNTTGIGNIAIGDDALVSNTSNHENIGIGSNALAGTTGYKNVGVGTATLGSNTAGYYNSALGHYADVSTNSLNNATAIGANSIVNASNKVRIGDNNVTIVEIAATAVYTGSDGRFKKNITSDVKGLEFINRLRPIVYNFDTKKFEEFLTRNMPDSIRNIRLTRDFSASTLIRRSGFIAQEVEIAANEVGYDFDAINKPMNENDNYSLAYSQFVVPLVKSVQELSSQNKKLEKAMEEQLEINQDLKKEMEELRAIVTNMASENKTGAIRLSSESAESKLYQNAPNPFNRSTIIRYSIPADAGKAILSIASIDGIKAMEFDLMNNAGQNIEISAGKLAPATYIYSLIVNDKLVDSKKMILTR
ncbi:MAG TPA: tail fiber domain-containing protein [Chitinophagaceae bacterium]|nr:tail fiber domain-containing protein [Chitinophagaceae bacterium]